MATRQPQYTFIWQGGEPTLMGVDFFREAVELQKKFAQPGAVIFNVLQTNGMLIDDVLSEFFHKYRFLIGISSLDGPQNLHTNTEEPFMEKEPTLRFLKELSA